MIFADPNLDALHNTARPGSAALAAAWEASAQVGGFTMAAVSHRHLLTAAHVGTPSGTATFPTGHIRSVVARTAHPTLDVALLTLDAPVPMRVPLFVGSASIGQSVTLIGSGAWRGDAVMDGGDLLGWLWGAASGVRWGTNLLSSVLSASISAVFTEETGSDEIMATTGDSGSPLLALEGGEQRLLGVITSVSRSGSAQFGDALFAVPVSAITAWLSPLIANDLTNPFMSLSNFAEEAIFNHVLRGVAFPSLGANLYVALFTADPGEAGSFTNEVATGSYARASISRATGSWKDPSTATQGQVKNTVAITFPTASASWGTVTHFAIVDAASGGNIWIKGALSAGVAIGSGQTPSFDISTNQLTLTLD